MMSHELRTPLNAVIGFAEFLSREDLDEKRRREYTEGVVLSSTALLELINDILDLSKLEAGAMKMRSGSCDIGLLLRELPAIFGYRVRRHGVKLVMDAPKHGEVPIVALSQQGMRQILINLVGNSAKFTDSGEIGVRMRWIAETRTFHFEIWDTGCGISDEKLSKLFDPFVQDIASRMKSSGGETKGTGLGLPIVKRMVDNAGGTITVRSELGKGTTFIIDIPELDPGTQGQVESALNTEDKVMKQFLYLLIAGNFLPNEESGIITTGTSNRLYSNMTGIMAGQLNSIFQKLDIPVDLGLNYQQGTSGQNIFDVALSTQLFNNRVVVNGTIGNRRLLGTTTDEMAGDIDIDIKLDKPGTIRLNLFSHSADQYTSYLDNSQRNGVGIAYQREFNTFRQFFQDLFTSREKREEQAAQEAIQPAQRRILQIDSTGKAHPIVTHE